MKIILSPAKKMKPADDHGFDLSRPVFEAEANTLYEKLLSMNADELKSLYRVSDSLLKTIMDQMESDRAKPDHHDEVHPALLTYSGIAFRSMAPDVFSDEQWDYVNNHLLILSGLFGIVRPLDGIWPYRLEMGSKMKPSLYEFWKDKTDPLFLKDHEPILNLASKEYSDLVPEEANIYDFTFQEEDEDGKRSAPAVYSKIARGTMVRWLAEHQVEDLEKIREFDELGYHFDPEASNDHHFVFVLKSVPKKKKNTKRASHAA